MYPEGTYRNLSVFKLTNNFRYFHETIFLNFLIMKHKP